MSSRIVARAAAAEVMRWKCFSRQNPPLYVGGRTDVALVAWLALAATVAAFAGDRFNSAKLSQMDAEIQRAITEHRLPGGVLWVECKGSNYHKAFGFRSVFPTAEAMTEDTIFDVASLTKVLATVPALMVLYERGKVKLEEPVVTYLPEFNGGGKEAITVRHLLTHTSGIGRGLSQEPDWFDFKSAFKMVCAETPSEPPGAAFLYSDLNFIILGEVVQRVAGMKLDEFCAQKIFKPLKMVDTCFLPSEAVRSRIAPTEKVGRTVLRGTVHDFKAQGMGGVAGHAGLFTTASDVARFSRMLLNKGKLDGSQILKAETVNLMTSVQSPGHVRARRGLGWDIDSDFSRPRGDLFPIGSFGHTGFTGVCLWIDPFSQTFWMFLSNRIHPDPSGNIYPLQRTLATLAAEAVNGFDFRDVAGVLTPPNSASARPARGFSYRRDDIPQGPWSIHVVKVDRSSRNLELHTALGNGAGFGLAPLSEQVKALPAGLGRPVAAINGDYYRDEGVYAGDPKGLQIMRGELVSGPCAWTCFWIDPAGNPQMTNVVPRFEVVWPTGQKFPFGLNEERTRNTAVLYTAVVGSSTHTSKGRDLVLERHGTNSWLPLCAGHTYSARVKEALESGNAPLTPDTMVLSIGPEMLSRLPPTQPGVVLQISTDTSPALDGVTTAIGGGPAMVRDGKAIARNEVNIRNPRAAIGWNRDYLYLVEVDGRQRYLSVGMTTQELSEYMIGLGCDSAMGLDGGGSATCWVYGQVMNRPSEGFERPMANSLVLVQKENK